MRRIRVTQDVLRKAIYEGVADAVLPNNQEQAETNNDLEEILGNFIESGEMLTRFGEHLRDNIVPEIRALYVEGIKVVKKVFGRGLNLGGLKSWDSGNEYSVEIPVTSFEDYKSFLENESNNFRRTLESFTNEITDYEEDLTNENYIKMKEAFFNDKEWLVSSIDEELDVLENDITCRYSSINISFSSSRQSVWIEIEYPIDMDKCNKFLNNDED